MMIMVFIYSGNGNNVLPELNLYWNIVLAELGQPFQLTFLCWLILEEPVDC